MLRFETIPAIRSYLDQLSPDRKVGFVPTMGALHEGHISLIERSVSENDITICSVFVNPIQFNNPEDLKNYPRNLEKDAELLESTGCDVLFSPSRNEMYPSEPGENFDFGALETVMEGKFRPGHFNGVAIVVNRFFDIITPHRAYFGMKDYQQLAVIRQLVKKTGRDIDIVAGPTIREESGLAMSSRNELLSEEEKNSASGVYQWLKETASMKGKFSPEKVKKNMEEKIRLAEGFQLEYLEIADADTLQPLDSWNATGKYIVCIAVYLGKVRLIDNLLF